MCALARNDIKNRNLDAPESEVLEICNDTVWTMILEKAIVHKGGTITFVFYNHTKIAVECKAA